MRTIAFADVVASSRHLFDEARAALAEHPRPPEAWKETLDGAANKLGAEGKLQIALIGQFNAGKSSLIAALTGADVHIDADVATSTVTMYAWDGVVLADTPGVQAQSTVTAHDEISRHATRDADLVLFVVSTELFNDRLAAHFRWVAGAEGLGLARKMAVVVNKMDRETNDVAILLEQVALAIAPHDDVPIYACSARSALDARTAPAALVERFWERSQLEELIAGVDEFARDRGMSGRLVTPLQIMDDLVSSAMESLTTDASSEARAAQLLRRKRKVLEQALRAIDSAVSESAAEVRSKAATAAEGCVRRIKDQATKEEVESVIADGLEQLARSFDACSAKLQDRVTEVIEQASRDLEELGASPLGAAVSADEARRGAPVDVDLKKVDDGRSLRKIVESVKTPLKKGLEHLGKNPRLVRDGVYRAGKAIGYRFRPWGAVKAGTRLSKLAGGLGKSIPFLSVALDGYFAYREETAEDERRAQLARARIGVHRTFAGQASQEAARLRGAVSGIRAESLEAALTQAEREYADACATEASTKGLAGKLGSIREKIRGLQAEVLDAEG